MTQQIFSQKLQNLLVRLEALSNQAIILPKQKAWLSKTVAGLVVLVEELRMAGENLQSQNEELIGQQDAINANYQYYHDLFRLMPECCLITDPRGTIKEVNQAGESLLNIRQDALAATSLVKFIVKEDRGNFYHLLQQMQTEKEKATGELQLKPWKRDRISVGVTLASRRDAQGNLQGLYWVMRDLSGLDQPREQYLEAAIPPAGARQQVAEAGPMGIEAGRPAALAGALRESEERLNLALTASRLGVWEWNVQTGKVFWSAEIYGLLGLKPGTALTFDDGIKFVHPEDAERVRAGFQRALDERMLLHEEFRLVRPDGEVLWVDKLGRGYYDAGGNPVRLLGTVQDITKRKHAQQFLEASQRFLTIANRHTAMAPLLQEFIAAIKVFFGCEMAGIRILDDQGNIPYEAYDGFSREFYDAENYLCLDRDRCMCINIVKGDTDLNLPCYTPGGSFYIGCLSRFFTALPPARREQFRGKCYEFGYESMALVPILFGGRILGMIHAADGRQDVFSRQMVEMLEMVAMQMGAAIQRVKAEEVVSRLAAIVESSDDAIIGNTLEGVITDWNLGAERVYGYSAGEVLGRSISLLVPPGQYDEVPEILEKIGRGELLEHYETVRIGKDGQPINVSLTISPIKDAAGKIIGSSSSARDITALKRAEEELQRREKELQVILDAVPAMIFYKDQENRFIRTNKALARAMGLAKEEMDGKSIFDLFPALAAQYWQDDLEVMHTGLPKRNIVEPMETPEGLRWAQTDKIPYRDAQGKIIGIVGFALDITEKKRAEEALGERTCQLEAVNRELEAFSYSVSHDLKAPLRAIHGFSRILREEHLAKLDPEGQRLLGIVQDNAVKMNVLIDDLLAFSRLGRQPLQPVPTDMSGLVRAAIAELQESYAGRAVAWQIRSLPRVLADPAMIRQVWVNLLANAVKFTRPQEKAVIEVGWRSEGDEDIFYVQDNGVGFDMNYAHKLFGVFQRLHRFHEFEGTGVGLSLAERIILRHGGRIWAEGEVGAGATFYFSLPRISR